MHTTQAEVRRRITAAMSPEESFSPTRLLRSMIEGGLYAHSGAEGELCANAAAEAGVPHDPNRAHVPLHALARAARRDLTTSTGSAGGYLVGEESPIEVHPLRPYSVTMQAGVTMFTGLRGDVPVPKLIGDPTAYWLATQGTQTTQSEMTFAEAVMTPKTVGVFVRVSRRLLLQGANMDAYIARVLLRTAGQAQDLAVLAGSGVSGQPTGIANMAGIGSASGSSVTWAGILTARASTVQAIGDDRSIKAIGGTTAQRVLSGREKAAGSGMIWGWDRGLQNGEIAGHAAFATRACAVDSLFLGDWAECFVGQWGSAVQVEVNPYENFQAGIVGFRVLLTTDVAVSSPAYFSAIGGIT